MVVTTGTACNLKTLNFMCPFILDVKLYFRNFAGTIYGGNSTAFSIVTVKFWADRIVVETVTPQKVAYLVYICNVVSIQDFSDHGFLV